MKMHEIDKKQFLAGVMFLEVALSVPHDEKRLPVWFEVIGKALDIDQFEFAVREAAPKYRWRDISPSLLIEIGRTMPRERKQISYTSPGITPFGRAAAALLRRFVRGEMTRVGYLTAAARLADDHNREGLAKMINEAWEKVPENERVTG